MYFSKLDILLNLASASIIVLKENHEIKAQFILFYTMYINNKYKSLAKVKKLID